MRQNCCYFNPRPREEGDKAVPKILEKLPISIHALVKRATSLEVYTAFVFSDFNPRPREEGDRLFRRTSLAERYFNPRPREEGDAEILYREAKEILFQSTPS